MPPEDVDEVTADLLLARTAAVAGPELGLLDDPFADPVAGFLAELRAAADARPSPVSAELAAVLREGLAAPPPPGIDLATARG